MADVRSMLRAERASRRIDHPHASYTSSGQLYCLICGLQLKSEALWELHTKSPQHTRRLQGKGDVKLAKPLNQNAPPARKRKATSKEDEGKAQDATQEGEERRKRSKPGDVNSLRADFFDAGDAKKPVEDVRPNAAEGTVALENNDDHEVVKVQEPSARGSMLPPPKPNLAAPQGSLAEDPVDEAEWAAFERDVATPPPEDPTISALNAPATIQAAPLSAADLAAQAREDQSTQRGRREAEVEAEQEEAARRLEDEFDEMEGLEERVRKLREKREALRRLPREDSLLSTPAEVTNAVSEDDDEASDEEDDWDDGWNIRAGET